jgi:hypothetical protein
LPLPCSEMVLICALFKSFLVIKILLRLRSTPTSPINNYVRYIKNFTSNYSSESLFLNDPRGIWASNRLFCVTIWLPWRTITNQSSGIFVTSPSRIS